MINEENYIRSKMGNKNPFTVPEGYFDDFATRMMEMLPEQEAKVIEMKPSVWLRWRPYVAAASICAVICGSALFYFGQQNTEQTTAHAGMNTPATESRLLMRFSKNSTRPTWRFSMPSIWYTPNSRLRCFIRKPLI